ncbi:Cytochrome P450 [Quillaja saponaria]|uniref:Cytochrome P450 n=1 Tax=Quillaja saponaria TaxID=32244 RepID=A0AAD7P899_QUISA|nr:Cytochrome P450 [Quillaja saponaria]
MSFFLVCLLILSLLLLMKKKQGRKKQNKNLPPGPPQLPIIGNLHQLGTLPHHYFWNQSKKYGPVILLQLGGVPTVVVSSAEAAGQVLKNHDLDCCYRPLSAGTGRLSYNCRDIAFAPYGNYWKEMRKFCVLELFSTKKVKSFRFIREQEVASLIDSISQSSLSAIPVDLCEKMMSLTASITCRVAFGKRFEGNEFDEGKFQEVVNEAMAMLGSFSASDFFPYVGWIVDKLTGLHDRLERSFHDLDGFYQQVIDQHLDSKETKHEEEQDIIDMLLKLQRNRTEIDAVQFTQDHIKAILMNIFLGGVDTTAITVVWAMAELIRNPRAMKKSQEEIRNCVGNKEEVDEGDIEQLKYLKMVVKETLRLHPPAPLLIPRETMSHFKINGYDIYPKTQVYVNAWAIQRDPDIWTSPEEFVPERFEDESIDFNGQNYELLPFGSGRRGCPGMYLGHSTVELALANLLYCFDWKLPDGLKEEDVNMEEVAGLTLYKKLPLNLVPVKYITGRGKME